MRTAVFGGSFNPPHVAHVAAAEHALASGEVDCVLVVPVFAHAFAKELAPFDDRVNMTRLAMRHLPDVEVSTIESRLEQPSYTVQTLERLRSERSGDTFRLLVGADILLESHKWHAFDRLTELAPVLALGRQGVECSDAPDAVLPEVSSSEVRAWLNEDSHAEELLRLVPRVVVRYICEHHLYGVTPGGNVDNLSRGSGPSGA